MKDIRINTGKEYSVIIGKGLLSTVGQELIKLGVSKKVCIITDKNVQKLYLSTVQDNLTQSGFEVYSQVITGGENSKSGENFLAICNFLAQNSFTRTDTVLALGGGIVGDLAGFVASAFARGINLVQMPTTLLSFVDSSVGGKTAINLASGKNLVGAFYQPNLVLGDLNTLETLPEREFACGMAEVIKYATVFDSQLFETLEKNDKNDLEEIIYKCITYKKLVVQADEFDNGQRQLLNFGHTLGHAIEKASDFTLSHGQAVGLGMKEIVKASVRAGLCDKNVYSRLENLLNIYGLIGENPYSLTDLMQTTMVDKKRKGEHISPVVCNSIGDCKISKMSLTEWKEFILG